jgi:hypothetical protein
LHQQVNWQKHLSILFLEEKSAWTNFSISFFLALDGLPAEASA